MRVATGAILAAHGAQKLFVYGFSGVTGAFTQMGIPMPGIAGPLTGIVEFFGGLALVVGLLPRYSHGSPSVATTPRDSSFRPCSRCCRLRR